MGRKLEAANNGIAAVTKIQDQRIFNGKKEPHTIIIARGDTIRHFTLKPWMVILTGTIAIGLTTCYLLATSYLIFRDDLIHGSGARQARVQQAYEDRIASLRTQLDRVTSRQMLDQKLMEAKIDDLIYRQKTLSAQTSRLAPVLQRAGEGLPNKLRSENGVPNLVDSEASDGFYGIDPIITGPTSSSQKSVPAHSKPTKLGIDKAELLFERIDRSLGMLETNQAKQVQEMSNLAYKSADRIKDVLASAGVVSKSPEQTGTGGPLILANATSISDLDSKIADLDAALVQFQEAKALANSVPIANPAPGMPVSSSFGPRRDPLLGLLAFHSGMDFRAASGSAVFAAAKGVVIAVDYNGGYGNMVDIDHGNGLSTRYGHMSQVLVTAGQQVNTGEVIGEAGSTGRSTGPHLHYEVRKGGIAVDPAVYLKIGRQIAAEL